MAAKEDNNLHFVVGAMFTAAGVASIMMLDGEKLSTGLQAVLVLSIIVGLVMMFRYPYQKSKT